MKHLYFIRHGESEANKARIWAGWRFNSPLTPKGVEQAKIAGAKAAAEGLKFDLILCSPLIRAQETARQIALATGYTPERILLTDDVRERNFGEIEGRDNSDLDAVHGKDETYVEKFKGVESMVDLQIRVDTFLKKVKAMPEDCILVASHGAFGRALNRSLVGASYHPGDTAFTQIPNAEIIKLL